MNSEPDPAPAHGVAEPHNVQELSGLVIVVQLNGRRL